MAEYEVEQTLVKTQKVFVEARNKDEARQLAKEGQGEVAERDRHERLLCDEAKRVSD